MIEQLRAHGFDAGPTQRPRLAGALAGLAAAPVFLFVLEMSGALDAVARATGLGRGAAAAGGAALALAGGVLYALVFRRAANDRRGGWMFGMAFSFALWMAVVLAERLVGRFAVGSAAMGLYGAHVLWGAALGALFPRVHRPLMRRPGSAGPAFPQARERGSRRS